MKPTHVLSSLKANLFIAFSALLGGCTTSTYIVQVDAIAQSAEPVLAAQPPQSYEIRTTNPKMDEGSLRYKEVAGFVKTALSGKGMYEAPRPDKADVVIDIDYGMDSPRIKFDTQSIPVYAQTGGGVRYEQVPIYDLRHNIIGFRSVAIAEPIRTELLTFEEVVRPVIVYEKFLKISARSNQEAVEGRAPPEVWSINVSAEDESKDCLLYTSPSPRD